MVLSAYLAAEGYERQLAEELGGEFQRHGRLFLSEEPARAPAWALNVWRDARELEIASIKDAARQLRGIQRNWVLWPHSLHRRAALVQEQLPYVSARPIRFPQPPPQAPLGSWTLLDKNRLLCAADCSAPVAHGEYHFEEDRRAPPNRAYLKCWEALIRHGQMPGPGDTCIDLGAAPGGWTWALQQLGAAVIAVDKAPLDPAIAHLPGVIQRQESAFGVDPRRLPRIDWLFCDVACYPQRLLDLLQRWREAGCLRRAVCTLKFQGTTDHEVARAFAALPGARLQHLYHNKHELTLLL